jgi:hypothetical protein
MSSGASNDEEGKGVGGVGLLIHRGAVLAIGG